jgi:hypothetical protein
LGITRKDLQRYSRYCSGIEIAHRRSIPEFMRNVLMVTFEEATDAFQSILSWNRESVEELRDWIWIITGSDFALMKQNLAVTLREFSYSVELSEAAFVQNDAPLIVTDKKGRSLVGEIDSLQIVTL